MKVLSVRQPWAEALFLGSDRKTVENRTWSTAFRGDVAVHASKVVDAQALRALTGLFDGDMLATSAVVGVVELVDVHVQQSQGCLDNDCSWNTWAEFSSAPEKPIFHWVLRNPRRFRIPVPASGSLGLWEAKYSLPMEIREQLDLITKEQAR
jgi:activating signal cointegrator 1